MQNKRGISAIVATVMIILITVAAIGILWAAIIPMIQTNLDFSSLQGRVSVLEKGYTAYDSTNEIVMVQVKRDVDEGVMNNIKISFDIGGNSYSNVVVAPQSGGTKVYYFEIKGLGEPDSVSVAPIFAIGNKEKEGEITSTVEVPKSRIQNKDANLELIMSRESLIDSDSWQIGSGSVLGYNRNGDDSENVREMGMGPHGEEVLLWKAVNDATSGPDGGWNADFIPIDHTKTYRVTVWIKKTGSNGGNTYFGAGRYGYDTVSNLAGGVNTNPYFWVGDLPELNKWYLLVGYIHGSGYSSTTSYGGIYDGKTGEKVISMTDYRNTAGTETQSHRAFLYYDTATTDRQYFWNPTFTDVTGYDLPLEIQ